MIYHVYPTKDRIRPIGARRLAVEWGEGSSFINRNGRAFNYLNAYRITATHKSPAN